MAAGCEERPSRSAGRLARSNGGAERGQKRSAQGDFPMTIPTDVRLIAESYARQMADALIGRKPPMIDVLARAIMDDLARRAAIPSEQGEAALAEGAAERRKQAEKHG